MAASPEVARDMMMADRNKRFADFVNNALFHRKVQALRGALIEHREHLIAAYACATSDDLRNILFVLLHSADEFLKLFPAERLALLEWPCDPMEKKVGSWVGITLVPGEKNARRNGIHGAYVMENNLSGNSQKEIVERDSGIYAASAGGKQEIDLRRMMLDKDVRHNSD
jgi:hypothetical protein